VQIPATTLKYFYRARVLQVAVTKLFETTWPQWRSLYKRHQKWIQALNATNRKAECESVPLALFL